MKEEDDMRKFDRNRMKSFLAEGGICSVKVINRKEVNGIIDVEVLQLEGMSIFPCACLFFHHKRRINPTDEQDNFNTVFEDDWKEKNVHLRMDIRRMIEDVFSFANGKEGDRTVWIDNEVVKLV